MYIVDINKITNINQELSIIPDDSDICIIDLSEVERLWPLDQNSGFMTDERRVVHDITKTFENYKNDIYYICSDCNIFRRYEKWCLSDPKKELKVYCFPFSIINVHIIKKYNYACSSIMKEIKGDTELREPDKQSVENYENIIQKKTKNFIALMCSPKLIRILFLDKFYKHKKMEYSFFPYYHLYDNQNKKVDLVINNNIRLSDYVLKLPYIWSNDGQCLQTINNVNVPLDSHFLNSKFNKLPNDFNFEEHCRELTEFVSEWQSNSMNKKIFNESLPIETFHTCCDIVFESYTNTDSVFFTEKTWKEIIFKRPFITFGSKNQNQIFKKLGFELYNDVFNYDFETRKTLQNRFNDFNDQILYFLNMDTEQFFQQIEILNDKINYNFNHYIDQLGQNKYSLLLEKYKDKKQNIVKDNDIIFKKALLELENIKQILK